MILVIDNFDSFTFNLVQYVQEIGEEVIVLRNNQVSLKEITDMKPMHGKISLINHDQSEIFHEIPSPVPVTRYHSLVVDETSFPSCLEISARTTDGEIMAIRHKKFKVEGVQFHPESILTESGMRMVRNFFKNNIYKGNQLCQLII